MVSLRRIESALPSAASVRLLFSLRVIYLDFNASTPVDPRVREAMQPFLGPVFGNPSSVHQAGRLARSLLDSFRDQVASAWKCKPSEVIFTSGGTESNNLALFGTARFLRDQGRHLITSRIEHHSVLHCFEYLERYEGFSVSYLSPDSSGIVSPDALAQALRPDTILVSIMAANNETGVLQPFRECGSLCRAQKVLFHTDAAQYFGKVPFSSIHSFNADLVSACAHKFYGPKGAGALFVKSPLLPRPILVGGGHENERRAGTENLAAVAGFAAASDLFLNPPVFPSLSMFDLSQRLISFLKNLASVSVIGDVDQRLPNTVSFSVADCDSMTLVASLDLEGFCVSSGSACSAGSLTPSHVFSAMQPSAATKSAFIRVSLGRESSSSEVDSFCEVLPSIITRSRTTCG